MPTYRRRKLTTIEALQMVPDIDWRETVVPFAEAHGALVIAPSEISPVPLIIPDRRPGNITADQPLNPPHDTVAIVLTVNQVYVPILAGDWIAADAAPGTFYPIAAHVFTASYEPDSEPRIMPLEELIAAANDANLALVHPGLVDKGSENGELVDRIYGIINNAVGVDSAGNPYFNDDARDTVMAIRDALRVSR